MKALLSRRERGRLKSRVLAIARHPLNRARPVTALVRWARMSRTLKHATGAVTIPFVGSTVLVWVRGAGSVRICAKFGLGEFEDMAFCLHFLRPGDLFCDVGANAGVYTVLASGVVGAHSVSVEPVPQTFALLQQNVLANGIAGLVEAEQCGVGDVETTLRFTSSPRLSYNHVTSEEGDGTVEAPVRTLDAILGNRVPRIIKIDVEGFEAETIAGCRRLLSDQGCTAVIMELSSNQQRRVARTRNSLLAVMAGYGFEPYWYDPFARRLLDPGIGRVRRHNVIFIRDPALVRKRVSSAPIFEVRGTKF